MCVLVKNYGVRSRENLAGNGEPWAPSSRICSASCLAKIGEKVKPVVETHA